MEWNDVVSIAILSFSMSILATFYPALKAGILILLRHCVMSDHLTVLHAQSVNKTFSQGDLTVDVLKDVNLLVNASETHAIMGTSGSGKSTLMHLLGGLDKPSSGEVIICDQIVTQLSARQIGEVRNKHLGFMYQFHHLLPEFSALENIAMPLFIRGMDHEESSEYCSKNVS